MIITFYETLFAEGKPVINPPEGNILKGILEAGFGEAEKAGLLRLFEQQFGRDALSFPGSTPHFHPSAALWGAIAFFRAASFYSFREVVETEVRNAFVDLEFPDCDSAEAHYSADIAMKYLPGLYQMAKSLGEDDVLLEILSDLAVKIPMSSVGIPVSIPLESPVRTNSRLAQLAVERALREGCRSILDESPFREIAIEKLGSYGCEMGRGLVSSPIECI